MITGELKSKIDRVWDAFWSGGISNPIEVIEQVTFLLFLRRLDDQQNAAERETQLLGSTTKPMPFPAEAQHLRWSRLIALGDNAAMHRTMGDEVFPFLRALGDNVAGEVTTYGGHMRDARYTIPNAALLGKVVDMLDTIPLTDRDTNGDLCGLGRSVAVFLRSFSGGGGTRACNCRIGIASG